MRLWSLHPKYLEAKGLVALWRESLLAPKVLQGQTKGYQHHPQLLRFKECSDPVGAVSAYLTGVADEADKRGYHFDRAKVSGSGTGMVISVSRGQLDWETKHLMAKLASRDEARFQELKALRRVEAHPIFRVKPGGVEVWERGEA